MSERDDWLALPPEELLKECEQEFRKARGHGGQKVNKTSCAVRLTHRATGLCVTADSSRSQYENRLHALSKLRREIAWRLREPLPAGPESYCELLPEPSVRSTRRLLWAARVLDVLAAAGWDPKNAAQLLHTSVSRLTRTLYQDPDLWQLLNRERERAGLHPLKGN